MFASEAYNIIAYTMLSSLWENYIIIFYDYLNEYRSRQDKQKSFNMTIEY